MTTRCPFMAHNTWTACSEEWNHSSLKIGSRLVLTFLFVVRKLAVDLCLRNECVAGLNEILSETQTLRLGDQITFQPIIIQPDVSDPQFLWRDPISPLAASSMDVSTERAPAVLDDESEDTPPSDGESYHSAPSSRVEGANAPKPSTSRVPKVQSTRTSFPEQVIKNTVICYVCQLPRQPGKFEPARAKALGLPPGENFGKLQRGESVVFPDGRLIHPHDVCAPSKQGPVFAVIDCPSRVHMEVILQKEDLINHCFTEERSPALIVHMTPSQLFESVEYQAWLPSFGPQATHIVINEDYCPPSTSFVAAAQNQVLSFCL
eukprot:m.136602 g.136602  ORF g.136602 m.136602 type:complete len:319 (+) comp52477_c0_seq2:391-1347(+)